MNTTQWKNHPVGQLKGILRSMAILPLVLLIQGCDDFLTVDNPGIIAAETLDPEEDAAMFAQSSWQNFVVAYGDLSLHSGFFTSEMWVDDSGVLMEVPRRDVTPFTHTGRWSSVSLALATAEEGIELFEASGGLPLARLLVASGYSLQMMAETFCAGVVRGGPLLSMEETLSEAQIRFEQALQVVPELDAGDQERFRGAALVGLARSYLQAGQLSQAAAAAAQVPDGFVFELRTSADPANRERLGNRIYDQMIGRGSQVVPPVYREMADAGDPRVSYRVTGGTAQGGFLELFEQTKFTGWDSPYRLASALEARYIEVEAEGDLAAMLAFVNERREAGNQGEFESEDATEILTEFLAQRSRDFWMEGAKRHGDWHRHRDLVPNVVPTGTIYKPGLAPVGDQVCFPIPAVERDNNPNID